MVLEIINSSLDRGDKLQPLALHRNWVREVVCSNTRLSQLDKKNQVQILHDLGRCVFLHLCLDNVNVSLCDVCTTQAL
jgi:hypothetical protein